MSVLVFASPMTFEKPKKLTADSLQMLEELEQLKTINKTQSDRLSRANLQLQHTHYVLRQEADGRRRLGLVLQQANQLLKNFLIPPASSLLSG